VSKAANHLVAFSGVDASIDDPLLFLQRAVDAIDAPDEALHISKSLLAVSRAALLAFGFRGPDFAAACVLVACRGLEGSIVNEKRLKKLIIALHLRSRGTVREAVLSIFASLSRLTRWLPFGDDFSAQNVDCYLPDIFCFLIEAMDVDADEPFGITGCSSTFLDVEKVRRVFRLQRICSASVRLNDESDIILDLGSLGLSQQLLLSVPVDHLSMIDETILDTLLRAGVPVFNIACGDYNVDNINVMVSNVEHRSSKSSRSGLKLKLI
jgi:hypothetical protein